MVWFTGWSFRKSHLITGAVGAVANYPVAIIVYRTTGTDNTETLTSGNIAGKVYVSTKCKEDYGDIRFTDDDGNTELKYWKGTVGANYAIFWVKVTDDLSSNATIYIYYGKSDATTTSDFDNTFVFGDDFHDTSLDTDRWTSVNGNPTYSIVSGAAGYIQVTDMDETNWYTGKGFHSKALTFPDQWILEDAYDANANGVYLYEATTANADINAGHLSIHHGSFSGADIGVACVAVKDAWAESQSYGKEAGVGGNNDYASDVTAGASYYSYWRIYKLSGAITIKEDGTTRVNAEANSEVPNIVHLGISRLTTYVFGTQRFGPFKIRPYCATEPAHSTWGTEEVSPKSSGSIVALMREMELI